MRTAILCGILVLGLAPSARGFTITTFDPTTVALPADLPAAVDAALGLGGLAGSGFETLTLAAGLTFTLLPSATLAANPSYPAGGVFSGTIPAALGLTGGSLPEAWDGVKSLVVAPDQSLPAPGEARVTFFVQGGASVFAIGLSSINQEQSARIYVNGVQMGGDLDEAPWAADWNDVGAGHNIFVKIEAGAGETIQSIAFSARETFAVDQLRFEPAGDPGPPAVPEPTTASLLFGFAALGLLRGVRG